MKMKEYLVIGIYDDGQRFAESYSADDPDRAEELALEAHPGLTVAGVLLGTDVVA